MIVTIEQLQKCMGVLEDEHLEFKEAKSNFHFDKLVKYCAALANEGGGRMVLGVTDKRPRQVVGSQAFSDLARTKAGLIERLHLRIEADEVLHPDDRVEELRQVLPALARSQIQVLLRELVREQVIHVQGATKAARWYPGSR